MAAVPIGQRERKPERPELSPISFAFAWDLQLPLEPFPTMKLLLLTVAALLLLSQLSPGR